MPPVQIRCQSEDGFLITLTVENMDAVKPMLRQLRAAGFLPTSSATHTESSAWPTGPDGKSPLCKKHGGVPMQERNRQGDTWHSHRLVHPVTGQELFCRGYRHGPADKDGFLIDT